MKLTGTVGEVLVAVAIVVKLNLNNGNSYVY
jgi:hypothetical protein